MADKKISQLTAATTPLAGTETLPIVQGGQTVKASAQSIANLAPAELPSQTGNNGKYLTTDGTTASWGTVASGPGFTYASWNFSWGGPGFFAFNQLANTTGISISLVASTNYIIVNSTSPAFTTNKTFVACSNIRFNTPSMAFFGGVEFTSTSELRLMYYDSTGAAFTFPAAASQPRIGVLTIQIYP